MNADNTPVARLIRANLDRELEKPATERKIGSIASEEELRELAEDIVRYCPSLTHLLLAIGSKNKSNPLSGMN